jgi:hypothetical protein
MIALNLRTPAGVNCIFEYIFLRGLPGEPITRLRSEIFASAALSWEPLPSRSRRCRKIPIFVSIHTHNRACGRFEKHARAAVRLPLVRYIIQYVIFCQNANRHRPTAAAYSSPMVLQIPRDIIMPGRLSQRRQWKCV